MNKKYFKNQTDRSCRREIQRPISLSIRLDREANMTKSIRKTRVKRDPIFNRVSSMVEPFNPKDFSFGINIKK
jgi:hypothetical protein